MNKRIYELALQAEMASYNGDHVDVKIMMAKFGALIVKECVDVSLEQKKRVEDQEVFNPQDEQWNRARIQQSQRIADKIKEHFGVEE